MVVSRHCLSANRNSKTLKVSPSSHGWTRAISSRRSSIMNFRICVCPSQSGPWRRNTVWVQVVNDRHGGTRFVTRRQNLTLIMMMDRVSRQHSYILNSIIYVSRIFLRTVYHSRYTIGNNDSNNNLHVMLCGRYRCTYFRVQASGTRVHKGIVKSSETNLLGLKFPSRRFPTNYQGN